MEQANSGTQHFSCLEQTTETPQSIFESIRAKYQETFLNEPLAHGIISHSYIVHMDQLAYQQSIEYVLYCRLADLANITWIPSESLFEMNAVRYG